MISVGSSDAGKGLGLGFGVGRDMEVTELEEGEACYYQKDDDSTLDPDVALSYIDEKLQDVLGHFQKDFEGGVSAENLGSKFGGYGSFLPTYQRSPAWSHPRTPPKVQNHSASRSPNNLHLEGGRCNSLVSSSASVTAGLGSAAVSVASLPILKAPSVCDLGGREASMSSTRVLNKSENVFDQKTLKVRIKVGSDNLSTRKKAEIYSGLGLDVSPSSSLGDSPADSEVSREPHDSPNESPTSILEIMTSLPVHGSLLLSPLPDHLTCLSEKEKYHKKSNSVLLHKDRQDSSVISQNGYDSVRGDRKVLGEKKPRANEKKTLTVELKNDYSNDAQNGTAVPLKKEADIDTLACEELVSNALRLPLLSNSYCDVVDSAKGVARAGDISGVARKGGVKEESFSDVAKDEQLVSISTQENDRLEKPDGKSGSDGTVWEFKKENNDDERSRYPLKGGHLQGIKTDVPSKAESNLSKGRKVLNPELTDPTELKAVQKATSYEDDDMKMAAGREQSSSGSKRKSKGGQIHGVEVAEVLKDNVKIDISCAPNSKKSTHANTCVSKSEPENIVRTRERYKEFFGDLELEQEDNEMTLEEISASRLNDSPMVGKISFESNSASKERLTGKKIDKPSTSEAYSRMASTGAPPTGNRPVPDPAVLMAPLVKEDWVCCDNCQKWRLLPFGTNPNSLPKMWLCDMLDWLPGMNRCSFSEEETTRALVSLYQIPAPGSSAPEVQRSQHRYPGGMSSGELSVGLLVGQNHQDIGGKKKHGSKDVNVANKDGLVHFPNSKKKNPQPSIKSGGLNGDNQSPTLNEVDIQHYGQSSSLVGKKHNHKKKEKSKMLENYGEGDNKSSKIRNKRETNQDLLNASKKLKTSGLHHAVDDWKSISDGAALKVGHRSNSGLSINETWKDRQNYADSHKDVKRDLKVPIKNPEVQAHITSDDGSVHMGQYVDRDVKKRKVHECQDTHPYSTPIPSGEHRVEDHRDYMEETSENENRKEKKARVSKSGRKEISTSKSSGGTDKKDRSVKEQQRGSDLVNNLSQHSLDAIDAAKRDLESIQPSLAATSSSSKVSGSHKNKASFHEVKGSPVESVSSSPLRVLNQDKFTSDRKKLGDKGDTQDMGFFARATPKKCSDGEDDERKNPSGIARKDENITVTNCGSLGTSVLDFQDRDLAHVSSSKAEAEPVPSTEFASHRVTDTLQGSQYPCKPRTADQCHDEERGKGNQYHANGSRRKSGKGSSSRSKDKSRAARFESKASEFNGSIVHSPNDEKSKGRRSKSQEKIAGFPEKVEKNIICEKDPGGNLSIESGKRESRANFGSHYGLEIRQDVSCQDLKQNLPVDRNGERSSKRSSSDKPDQVDVSGKGKSRSLPPSGRSQSETTRWPQPLIGSHTENGGYSSLIDAAEGDDALKAKQIKKADNQNENQPVNSRQPTLNGHKGRDLDTPSPARRDSLNQAATNAVKEAKDLKHLADRFKNSESNLESTSLYFQAALKFLHGASLLESCNSDNAKHGEMVQSIQMYSSTAKLCEFCGHEYEKSKDMAAAALAYKCEEVAYLRVIYSSHAIASRDRHELQTSLQIVPPGESPSSSASDVDNLNNPVTADKVTLAKGLTSPQVAGNHVIAARNRSNFVRLLNFAQDVNLAMEASRKSRIAFTSANSRLQETKYREGTSSVKKALDFNFQDVEGLLRLVRLAMEAISR